MHSSKKSLGFLFSLFVLLNSYLFGQEPNATPYVLVTVAPYKFFVEKIAGDTIKVGLMVPAGTSAHTYEPTPKQMLLASTASIWFHTGEPFENRAIQALKSHNRELYIVDMRQGLDLIKTDPHSQHTCCHAHSEDPHFWLSPRLAAIQATTIANALIRLFPEHAEMYRQNLEKFHKELYELDLEIQAILEPIQNRAILVSHPAYAYFCQDYGLTQYSIEFEGKDPTPQQLTKILILARQLKIKTIFIQEQYSSKGARLIAKEIGANVVTLNPYAEQYIESMLTIARAFAQG